MIGPVIHLLSVFLLCLNLASYFETWILTKDFTKEFRCKICDKTYVNENGLKAHRKRHHEQTLLTCEQCGKKIRPEYLEKHLEIHNTPEQECGLCGRFVKLGSLKGHQKSAVCISMQFIRKREAMKSQTVSNEVQIVEDIEDSSELLTEIKIEKDDIT